MIKAVFFDIDGTLLSHSSGTVPESTRAALQRLKQTDVKIFASTGRHMLELEELGLLNLPFDGYVTLNGQICLDSDKRLLYSEPMEPDDTEKLVSVFNDKQVPVMIVEMDSMYINFVDPAVYAAQQEILTRVPECGTYTGNSVYQFILYSGDEQAKAVKELLPSCKINRWNDYAFDVISRTGGKATGIRHILQHFGIGRDEIMTFGDGGNDIDMLCYAGIGVAMGNAADEVKRQADYVTADVDHDGILLALEHYGLL